MDENKHLADALAEAGLTQVELGETVSDHLRAHGHAGTVGDRTVRNWLTGKTRWPHSRQREALEAVFDRTAEELGFVPPAGRRSPTRTEDPVNRRNFLTAATGTAAAVSLVATRPYAVGTTDVIRLRSGLDALTALDASTGGHEALERAALAGAAEALELQKRAASQRVRQRLYGVAADYTATAAWSAVDARQRDRARDHLNRALHLAGLGAAAESELRVWNAHAMLACQGQHFAEAVHAAQAAQATSAARRDPLFASLAHARTAIGHAASGDRQSALRSLGYAEEALTKSALDSPRPTWVAFYGPAELLAITSYVRDDIGDPAGAEAASHRALAALPQEFRRNRALATLQLALTQLHQGDVDQACATAEQVFTLMRGSTLPGRMRSYLGDFIRDLTTLAPGSGTAREWEDRYRSEWSRAR
ncbi:XRE family transcriptional regulator [Streptomyces murinus]|uniref:Tetratricopeptide (TPR) repeat protein n=1 Tax=Streptomyces murinus TaxID=33900 RepID=A0A7W3NR83_STRMR|nr:XRE family transcriptional regulator [Streptomyces murinus]MBA9055286.1 tetratricopeptide (TPR) repeat protein [Streptomyces murinus]UWW89882.1 XRE family transcriptional regulator [Streptomyces murinus]WUD08738.1 XRE family transcriptional regulator [Streptomyces murinus]